MGAQLPPVTSTTQENSGRSLEGFAGRRLATKQLAGRSRLSDAARRADLAVIARHLADYLGRDEALGGDAGAFERELARLQLANLDGSGLRGGLRRLYATDHAARPSLIY